jgi:hypothetical protein
MYNITQQAPDHLKILRHELILKGDPVPLACPYDLVGWVNNVYTSGTMLNPEARGENGPYIDMLRDIAIGWVAMPRTLAEIRTILSSRCQCNPQHAGSRPHKHGAMFCAKSSGEDPVSILIGMFFSCLLRIRQFPMRRPFDLDGREDWPINIGQLLPYGAEDTMRGVLAWLKAPVSGRLATQIFNFTHLSMKICAPTILPSVIACHSLLDSLVNCVRSSAAVFFDNQSSIRWDPMFVAAYHLLQSSITLLNDIVVLYANQTQIHRFVGARGQAVLDAVEKGPDPLYLIMLRIQRRAPGTPVGLNDALLSRMDDMYNDIGGAIYDAYPKFHSSTMSMARRWQPASKTFGLSVQHALWVRFVMSLRVFELVRQCRNPGCTNVFYHPRRQKDSVCGGCRRTAYCSRQCQKRAWTHPTAPHRIICGALRYLCVRYALPRRHTGRKHSNPPTDTAYVDAAQTVLNHFVALTTADMSTSSR